MQQSRAIDETKCFPPSTLPRKRIMSTALVRIYVKDGFLIAADGMTSQTVEAPPLPNAQKIFPLSSNLAVCFAGHSRLGSHLEAEPPFIFSESLLEVASLVAEEEYSTLAEYCLAISMKISSRLDFFFGGRKILPGMKKANEEDPTII